MADWNLVNKLGFSNQMTQASQLEDDPNQLFSQMSPEQAKALKERIEKVQKQGGSIVAPPNLSSDAGMLKRLTVQAPGSMIDPETRALSRDLRTKYKEIELGVEQGIEGQKQIINDYKNLASAPDFTAIAALADKWSGDGRGSQLTQVAASMKGPNDHEKLEKLMKMQGQTQDDYKSLLSELGTRMGYQDQMKMNDASMKNQRFLAGQDMSLAKQFTSDLRKDTDKFVEAAQSARPVLDALQPDANGEINIANVHVHLSNAARQLGEKGVLTDQDINRIFKTTIDKWVSDFAVKAGDPNAKIKFAEVKALRQAVEAAHQAAIGVANRNIDRTRRTAIATGLPKDYADNVAKTIYGDFVSGNTIKAPDTAAADAKKAEAKKKAEKLFE